MASLSAHAPACRRVIFIRRLRRERNRDRKLVLRAHAADAQHLA